jgi:hypothetical protein
MRSVRRSWDAKDVSNDVRRRLREANRNIRPRARTAQQATHIAQVVMAVLIVGPEVLCCGVCKVLRRQPVQAQQGVAAFFRALGGGAPGARCAFYLRLLPVGACRAASGCVSCSGLSPACHALVSLRLPWGSSPFAFMHLLLCSRPLGRSQRLKQRPTLLLLAAIYTPALVHSHSHLLQAPFPANFTCC